MNLLWRMLWVLCFSRFSSPLSLFDESSIRFRVLPTDIDVLFHLNNGRYFSFMDLARTDYMIRSHTFKTIRKNKLYPVIASEMIRFKKSIGLFKQFLIKTNLIGWDDKFFYLAQHFIYDQDICALSMVKVRFLRQSGGSIDPHEVLQLLAIQQASPLLPEWITHWQKGDQAFHDHIMSK